MSSMNNRSNQYFELFFESQNCTTSKYWINFITFSRFFYQETQISGQVELQVLNLYCESLDNMINTLF